MNWTIIVPLKALPGAKSRLVAATADPNHHVALVEAIRADTLAVAAAVGRVLVVVDSRTDAAGDWPVVVQVEPGLNQALREAAAYAAREWPDDAVAALVGDLPAVTVDDLAAALTAAAHSERGYVPDRDGTGTTLLTALPGVPLDPAFGPDSAARHDQIAQKLPAGPGLRLDVDTTQDLDEARILGLGAATAAFLAR